MPEHLVAVATKTAFFVHGSEERWQWPKHLGSDRHNATTFTESTYVSPLDLWCSV